jgi:hypothetical protein
VSVVLISSQDLQRLQVSVTAFMGLALGTLISGVFVTFAPWPTHLVYALLLGVTLAEMVILAWIAETTSRKAGA